MKILNLTQHKATLAQEMEGVYNCEFELSDLLTFEGMPTKEVVISKIQGLLDVVLQSKCEYLQEVFAGYYDEMQDASFTNEDALIAAKGAMGRAEENYAVMLGGAPWLMAPLESNLKLNGIKVLYAYSERVSEEVVNKDGSVSKRNVFKHLGFYEA